MIKLFEQMAEHAEETYGTHYDRDLKFFVCPECGEPIDNSDWVPREYSTFNSKGDLIFFCPVCGEEI